MELSCSWDRERMRHPCWEPLWKAVTGVGPPLPFHPFPSLPPGKLDQQKALTRRAAFFTAVSSFQMNLINILSAVIGAAVLERYPRMRISFGESGIGWLPYALDRMRSEEHTSELQSLAYLVCRLLLEKKKSAAADI